MFTFACLFMGAYMTVTQSVGFLENRDSSTISYNHFNQDPSDQYPTFSICLKGKDIFWENEEFVFDNVGVTSAEYVEILKGNGFRYKFDEHAQSFQKEDLDINNVSMINFESITLKPSDVILGSELITNTRNSTVRFGTRAEDDTHLEKTPFYIGYRSPDETCFSRRSTYEPNVVRHYDLIFMNGLFLKPGAHSNLEMKVIVHYPGQLLRNYDNPRYSSTFDSHNREQILELKISHVTTLKKRPSSNVRCDDTIESDDAKFREEVVKNIKCIPVYWKGIMPNQNNSEVCQSSRQLRDAAFLIENLNDVLDSYDPPCAEMSTLVTVNKDLPQTKDQFKIMIRYTELVYQNIENSRGTSFETFFSGVGGFVGIFCGYSIMQVPEFFDNAQPRIFFNQIKEKACKCDYCG